MGKRKTFFGESAALNNYTYFAHKNKLTELAVSVFEWVNMPATIDPRFLEMQLFYNGSICFFEDDVLGYLCLPWTNNGNLDVYNNPIKRTTYASNGYNNSDLTEENSVIIYNNFLRQPSAPDIDLFARRLYNVERAIDVNANAQKTPIIVICDERERLSMLNLIKEYDGNAPIIFGSKKLDLNNIKVVNTEAPFRGLDLYQLYNNIWNEALTFIGIHNIGNEKKERNITAEIDTYQDHTLASRNSKLGTRKLAAEQINRIFGLNVDVVYRGLQNYETQPISVGSEVYANE